MMKSSVILLFCLFAGLFIVSASSQQDILVLTLKYVQGNISVQNLIHTQGVFYPPANSPREGYTVSIISFDNNVLYSQVFDFALVLHYSPPDPSWFDAKGNQIGFAENQATEEEIILEISTIELLLPYYENASRIDVKNSSHILALSVPINTEKYPVNAGCSASACTFSPKTCPKWGTQKRTCTESCTNKTVTEEISCTPGNKTVSTSEPSIWEKILGWFRRIFR
jgi:hypothetical protein